MLLPIERLIRRTADRPPEVRAELINPASIERVREAEAHGDEPCVDLLVQDEWFRCLGTVPQVGHAVNELLGLYDGQTTQDPSPQPDQAAADRKERGDRGQ